MSSQVPGEPFSGLLAGRTPHHVGYVVADLDATLADLSSGLGVAVSEPLALELTSEHLERGGPASLRLGFAMLGDVMAEFIEPRPGGGDVWSRALRDRGPGLHHVAFTQVQPFGPVVQELTGLGFVMTAAGQFADDRWCYLERGPLVVELTSGAGPAGRFGPGAGVSRPGAG